MMACYNMFKKCLHERKIGFTKEFCGKKTKGEISP